MPFLVWLMALVGGAAVAIQAQFIGTLDRRMGTLESVFITYGGGGVAALLMMTVLRGGNLAAWRTVPGYVLVSGLLGLVIIGAISFTVNRLGLVAAMVLMLLSQLAIGAILGHFGWLGADLKPVDWGRLAGLAMVLAGTYLVVR
jgi:transporter family-2 protein